MKVDDLMEKERGLKAAAGSTPRDIPQGVWSKCEACKEPLLSAEFERGGRVCANCGFHYPLSAWERIEVLTGGRFSEYWANLRSVDPLGFVAGRSYLDTLEEARCRTGLEDAVVTGQAWIGKEELVLAVMDFRFIGGSMGSVVGEKVTRAAELALSERLPLVAIVASGGARMQEGMFSLMQMAKTSAAVGRLNSAGVPYVSLLTQPSTGGVLASFATLADIILAEPGALVGFTGPRVIEKTIKEKLPRDFQKSESMLERGMIDMIVPRSEQKETITRLLRMLKV